MYYLLFFLLSINNYIQCKYLKKSSTKSKHKNIQSWADRWHTGNQVRDSIYGQISITFFFLNYR